MTRTARHPIIVETPVPGAARCLELVWDLSSRAGRALAEQRGFGRRRIVAVVLRIASGHGPERAVISSEAVADSGERLPLEPRQSRRARWAREGDLEHIDIDGLLRCTLRHADGARALYASTPLLASLGVAPGAYSLRPTPGE